ncbi:Carbon-nitrogen hydrolase [Pleurostoma richardsiae]|uniref:Carbon-nitrogen hydrolase n=1 Tax=Pleurostoma richardsiae TaxID=41990 RepID=A0AA38RCF3_9PEZI|nr:Carbon-nitrogen hydrolase [Pleurostoma richardsiae]
MAPVYKVAIIQLQAKPLAVKENFTRAANFIRDASAQGAHLAVLPEYHLTSWEPGHPDFVSACAESVTYLPRYQALARDLNINIVPGTICIAEETKGSSPTTANPEPKLRTYNTAHFIAGGTGEIISSYQKRNLWHPERPHLTPGTAPHTAFDTPLTLEADDGPRPLRAGILICWDLAFPEPFRQLIADNADMIIVPSFWRLSDIDSGGRELNPDSERLFLESVTVARAFENTCAVVFCNVGGFSQVAMPILGARGKLMPEAEEMSVVDIDFSILRLAEDNYKIREDMARKGWQYAA